MSHWKCWPKAVLNAKFAEIEHPDRIIYPNLRDGSPLVLACDHSGEHAEPEFRVLSFLVTTYKSVSAWDPLRCAVRNTHLADGRRMSFKALNESLRINAFSSFLRAAGQLNGVLICVGVEKGYSRPKDNLPLQHDWTVDTLNKLVEICAFGAAMVDGLRGEGQPVHWITDDDSTVSTEKAMNDAMNLMGGLLHKYPDELLDIALGIASQFDDDLRAEDLVAIPDLAGGAFSETLTTMGKANVPKSDLGPMDSPLLVQIKSFLINTWRSETDKPLKHMNALVRPADNGQTLVSFGKPFSRTRRPDESAEGVPTLNSKWRRAFEAHLKAHGVNPNEVLKSMGIDI